MQAISSGPDIDALILANHAEAPNGLLYILGGAWSRCWPPQGAGYPYERALTVVVAVRVPWRDTNQDHAFSIEVRDSDNNVLARAEGGFKAGRQLDLTDGASQVVVMTLTLPALRIERPGIYNVVASINGEPKKKIEFEAIASGPR